MSHKISFPVLALLALALAGVGCDDATLAGHYEGTLFRRVTSGDERLERLATGEQTPVKTDIKLSDKGRNARAVVVGLNQKTLLSIDFSEIGSKSLKISVPGYLETPVVFKIGDSCSYYAPKSGAVSARFCFESKELVLEISKKGQGVVFTLAVDRFRKVDGLQLEEPVDFTLSEAVKTAFERNFDNRTEFENVRQARLTRTLTRRNLLPGVTLGSLVSLVVLDPASIIGSLGDLAPFLIPTRWFQAKEAGDKLEAEQDTLILLRADTATQVEGFAYVLERDEAIRKFYAETLVKAQDVADDLKEREDVGQFPDGTDDAIEEVVNNIQQAIIALDLVIAEDKTSVAQTLGLRNPLGVRSLTIDQERVPVGSASNFTRDDLRERARERSFELRQMDSLIKVGKYQRLERYFTFLDPAGDPTGKLGAGSSVYVQIGTSQLAQLYIHREAVDQAITIRVDNALSEYNTSLVSYKAASEGMAISQDLMMRLMEDVDNGTNLSLALLVQDFQDYLSQEVNVENALAAYRVARAKIDRFLLQGYYSELATRK